MAARLMQINEKMGYLRNFFIQNDLQIKEDNVKGILNKLIDLKKLQGNTDNDIHFLASLLAYSYLKETHGIEIDLDKPVGRSGIDIESENIVGEIKTTIPYHISDFGANQKKNIMKDLDRLELSSQKIKYFFVIDKTTEKVLRQKYAMRYPSVKIINLLKTK